MRKLTVSADLLGKLITKAGLKDDPDYKEVFAADGKDNFELTDAALQKLHDNVTTIEAAKNIPDLDSHFKGVYFGKTDAKVKAILKTKGYSDDEIKTLIDGKGSEEKIEIAIDAIEKKAGKGSPSEREAQLSKSYNDLKSTHEAELKAERDKYAILENTFNQHRETSAFQSSLGAFKLRTDIDSQVVTESAMNVIRRAAESKGAALVLSADGRSFELRSKADPTKPAYAAEAPTTPLDFTTLATGALDSAKLLDKTGRPPGEQQQRRVEGSEPARTGDRQSSSAVKSIFDGVKDGVQTVV